MLDIKKIRENPEYYIAETDRRYTCCVYKRPEWQRRDGQFHK